VPVLNDVLKLTHVQSWTTLGEPILNRYYYQITAFSGSASLDELTPAIGAEFESVVIDKIRLVQSNTLVHTQLQLAVMSVVGEESEWNYSPPVAGTLSGEVEPPQNALSFKLIRTTKLTRHGSKRIGGYGDALIADGHGTTLPGDVRITDIETALASPLNIVLGVDVVVALEPVICRFLPGSETPSGINPIKGALFRGLGSQNSRKRLL
jgi:hypothetical protein